MSMDEGNRQSLDQAVLDAQEALTELETTKADADSVPSIEELTASSVLTGTISSSVSYSMFVAPFACRIVAASVVQQGATITTSDTNYWTVDIRKFTGDPGVATIMASKTTKVTGGEQVPANADWNFDAAAWSNNTLAKGEIVNIGFTKTASAANWDRANVTIRYEPV